MPPSLPFTSLIECSVLVCRVFFSFSSHIPLIFLLRHQYIKSAPLLTSRLLAPTRVPLMQVPVLFSYFPPFTLLSCSPFYPCFPVLLVLFLPLLLSWSSFAFLLATSLPFQIILTKHLSPLFFLFSAFPPITSLSCSLSSSFTCSYYFFPSCFFLQPPPAFLQYTPTSSSSFTSFLFVFPPFISLSQSPFSSSLTCSYSFLFLS